MSSSKGSGKAHRGARSNRHASSPRGAIIGALGRRAFLILLGGTALVGCKDGDAPLRCPTCGMPVAKSDRFRVEGRSDEGRTVVFDSPKCAFRWAEGGTSRRARSLAFTEYYSQEPVSLADSLFVMGSDVMSPMGRDVVPIRGREAAERFAQDHGGRVIEAREIDAQLLASLDTG